MEFILCKEVDTSKDSFSSLKVYATLFYIGIKVSLAFDFKCAWKVKRGKIGVGNGKVSGRTLSVMNLARSISTFILQEKQQFRFKAANRKVNCKIVVFSESLSPS